MNKTWQDVAYKFIDTVLSGRFIFTVICGALLITATLRGVFSADKSIEIVKDVALYYFVVKQLTNKMEEKK